MHSLLPDGSLQSKLCRSVWDGPRGINPRIKTPEVRDTKWIQTTVGNWHASVYKDKAARDSDPNSHICSISGSFDMDLKDSAKNPVKQAYVAAKAMDLYKDMADA